MQSREGAEQKIIQDIYGVVDAPVGGPADGWQQLLVSLTHYFEADKGHAFLVDPRQRVVDLRMHNYDLNLKSEIAYHQHYQAMDPRFEYSLHKQNEVFSDALVFDRKQYERTEIHNDFLMPLGIAWSLCVNISYGAGKLAPQGFFRGPRQRPFRPEEVRRFQALVPHLARSLHLRELLHQSTRQSEGLQRLLDGMKLPSALLGPRGEWVCSSATARELIEAQMGLALKAGRLVSLLPATAARLENALKIAVALSESGREGTVHKVAPSVDLEREGQPPLTLMFLPLRPDNGLRRDASSGRVLLVFHDPSAQTPLDPGVLARYFGLTPTEALLLVALTRGKTVADFAAKRGCSEQTARVHLKRLLDKTGTRRQAELVAVVLQSHAFRIASQL